MINPKWGLIPKFARFIYYGIMISKGNSFKRPKTFVADVLTRDVICGSVVERSLNFGGDNEAGSIDDSNYYNGGSF